MPWTGENPEILRPELIHTNPGSNLSAWGQERRDMEWVRKSGIYFFIQPKIPEKYIKKGIAIINDLC